MKKVLTIVGVLLLLLISYLAIDGMKMKTVSTEIEISAPPSKVWGIITEIDKWHEWNPTINASKGTASVGSALSITMMSKVQGKDGPKYSPKIIMLDEPSFFHWRAHMMAGFIFTNEKIIELEATDTGTKLFHKETFKGMMASMMGGQMEQGVPPMLKMFNEALKQVAEQ